MRKKMPNFLYAIRSKIPRHFTQVLATLAVSLGPFSAGLGKGYSSPALASLQQSKSTSFAVSPQEESWVASLSLLGALFGCLVGGFMLQLGRKMSLLIVALPFSCSWLLTVFAQRVEMIYSTSFIGGFFSAITLLATQVYVSEIAHPEIRGCLSSVLKMAGFLGHLCSSALGAFLDWRQLAAVAACAPVLFFLAILPIPETPSFLLYHGRDEEASKSMTWLRSKDEDVATEVETLRSNIKVKTKRLIPKCSSQFLHLLCITCGLMFFHKFSGVTVFNHYAVPIFQQDYDISFDFNNQSGSLMVFGRSLNPHGASIIVVLLQLLGAITSGLLIDTAGRLPLLTLSSLFISASCFGFGLYNYLEATLPPWNPGFGPSMGWIPLTCVLVFTLFFSIGIGPISWLLVGELFPLEYRELGGAISTAFSYACAFTAVKTYVDINSQVGLHGAFWIYSAVSILGLFFICCVVPETKGIELEEMHHANSIPTTMHSSNTSTSPNVVTRLQQHTKTNQPRLNLNPMESHFLNKKQKSIDQKLKCSSTPQISAEKQADGQKIYNSPNIVTNYVHISNPVSSNPLALNFRNSAQQNFLAANNIKTYTNNLNASPSLLAKIQQETSKASPLATQQNRYEHHTRFPSSDFEMYKQQVRSVPPPLYSLPPTTFTHQSRYQSHPYLTQIPNNVDDYFYDFDDNETVTTNDIDKYDKLLLEHFESLYDDDLDSSFGGASNLEHSLTNHFTDPYNHDDDYDSYQEESEDQYLPSKRYSSSSLPAANYKYSPMYQYQPQRQLNSLLNSSNTYIHHNDPYLSGRNGTNV